MKCERQLLACNHWVRNWWTGGHRTRNYPFPPGLSARCPHPTVRPGQAAAPCSLPSPPITDRKMAGGRGGGHKEPESTCFHPVCQGNVPTSQSVRPGHTAAAPCIPPPHQIWLTMAGEGSDTPPPPQLKFCRPKNGWQEGREPETTLSTLFVCQQKVLTPKRVRLGETAAPCIPPPVKFYRLKNGWQQGTRNYLFPPRLSAQVISIEMLLALCLMFFLHVVLKLMSL